MHAAMRPLLIHVGYPKCGSTALQEALDASPDVAFPARGRHGGEHLALPLHLRGVDPWTAQWFDAAWVERELGPMMDELAAAPGMATVSSERLAALSPPEIDALADLFGGWDARVLVVTRDRERYLDSTWRHAVFRHDYHVAWDAFRERMAGFSFGDAAARFGRRFPVTTLSIDAPDFADCLARETGIRVALGRANTGVGRDLAEFLQGAHARMGSALFKATFTHEVKQRLAADETPRYDAFDVPLF